MKLLYLLLFGLLPQISIADVVVNNNLGQQYEMFTVDYGSREIEVKDVENKSPIELAYYASVSDAIVTKMSVMKGLKGVTPWSTPDDAGLLAFTSFKMAIVGGFVGGSGGVEQEESVKTITSLWSGASTGNMLLALGLASPLAIVIGVVSGAISYSDTDKIIKINKEKLARLKSMELVESETFINAIAKIEGVETSRSDIIVLEDIQEHKDGVKLEQISLLF